MKVAQKPARGLQHNETVNRSNSVAERNLHCAHYSNQCGIYWQGSYFSWLP